jgi:hypothetical protein
MTHLSAHHIGVQTVDLPNSVRWYLQFFDGEESWSLDTFSEVTHKRLSGIKELVEIRAGSIKFHLIGRFGVDLKPAKTTSPGFQHACLRVNTPADLSRLRERWIALFRSGKYTFVTEEEATEIVIDDDDVQSFYAFDPNGLEFEFSYVPIGRR